MPRSTRTQPFGDLAVVSPRFRVLPTTLLVVVLAIGASSCGDDDPTPEEARLQRVEERLKLSFTDEQVGCMIDQFSEKVLKSLDGEGTPAGDALDEFTTVARACVIGSEDTVPGTPDTEPTTTAPETTEPAPDDTTAEASSTSTATSSATTAPPEGDPGGGPATRPEAEGPANGDGNGDGDGTDRDD